MNRQAKTILIIVSIILIITFSINGALNWTRAVMEGKPDGPYYSSGSVNESRKNNLWLSTYSPDSKKYFSADKSDFFSIAEVWIEKNMNDKEIYLSEADYENILCVYFKNLTKDNLHKFRLIPAYYLKLDEYEFEQVEYPDDTPRVRFLMNRYKDTIRIEVLERNPNDSLSWMTEKIIDTITLIKKY